MAQRPGAEEVLLEVQATDPFTVVLQIVAHTPRGVTSPRSKPKWISGPPG